MLTYASNYQRLGRTLTRVCVLPSAGSATTVCGRSVPQGAQTSTVREARPNCADCWEAMPFIVDHSDD